MEKPQNSSPEMIRVAGFLPLVAVLGSTASFQIGAVAAKGLFPLVGTGGAASLRLALGALLMSALFRPWRAWPRGANSWLLVALGGTLAGDILFFYSAVERLPLGVVIAIQFLGPLSVAVLGSRRLIDIFWVALAAGGVWALVASGQTTGALDSLGVAMAFGAAAGWGLYIVIGRATSSRLGNVTAPLTVLFAALFVLPFGIAEAGTVLISRAVLPGGFLAALFSAVIPFSLEFYAMPRMPARTFAILMSLEPAFGVLAGFILLDEILTVRQMLGIGIIMAASAGSSQDAARKVMVSDLPTN